MRYLYLRGIDGSGAGVWCDAPGEALLAQLDALSTAAVNEMSNAQYNAYFAVTPIVLDLDGHGVNTLAAAQGVNFDLMGTGTAQLTGWVTSTEGLLAVDLNHDGKINDGTELFGSATRLANGQMAGDGFTALKEFDSNHDGKVNAADQRWNELKVWVDANHNGVTDAGVGGTDLETVKHGPQSTLTIGHNVPHVVALDAAHHGALALLEDDGAETAFG